MDRNQAYPGPSVKEEGNTQSQNDENKHAESSNKQDQHQNQDYVIPCARDPENSLMKEIENLLNNYSNPQHSGADESADHIEADDAAETNRDRKRVQTKSQVCFLLSSSW